MIKAGDEVYLGAPVTRIPDITTMMLEGIVMENDIGRIRPGLNVIVRLDALSSISFHGVIKKISRVCLERDNRKIFTTEVIISESDPRPKPGMTVSCEYITWEGADEMYVPDNSSSRRTDTASCIHTPSFRATLKRASHWHFPAIF